MTASLESSQQHHTSFKSAAVCKTWPSTGPKWVSHQHHISITPD